MQGNSQLSATQMELQATPGSQERAHCCAVEYGGCAEPGLKSSNVEQVGEAVHCAPMGRDVGS